MSNPPGYNGGMKDALYALFGWGLVERAGPLAGAEVRVFPYVAAMGTVCLGYSPPSPKSYLPFMVLPLYASLEKLDETLLEAAADLGCPRWKAFCVVTVPLALPGLGAGALLCFIPIVGEFVIPDLLGGSDSTMIGQTLWTEFFANKDWPVASAVAVVLVILLVGPIAVYQHLQAREIEER